MKDNEMESIPCDNDEGMGNDKGAGNARVAVVAMGIKETGDCGRVARLGNAGKAGVAVARARKMEGEAAGEEGNNNSGVWKWMWLLAQSINGFSWCNQLIPSTAEMSGSNVVTRNVIGMVW